MQHGQIVCLDAMLWYDRVHNLTVQCMLQTQLALQLQRCASLTNGQHVNIACTPQKYTTERARVVNNLAMP